MLARRHFLCGIKRHQPRLKHFRHPFPGKLRRTPAHPVAVQLEGAGNGDGPVDAAYSTIRRLTGRCPKLVDYHIHSVTSGTDALGEVRVALEEGGKTAVGRGNSTDVIVASALAYVNALNRLENLLERKAETAEAVRSTP